MKKYFKNVLCFSVVLSSLFVFSCREKDEIVFNQSDLDAVDIEYKWAVVNTPYVACRETPSYEGKVAKNLRKGAMEKIIGEKTVKVVDKDVAKYEKWLAFEDGWVPENTVDVYLNKLRAEKASKLITE